VAFDSAGNAIVLWRQFVSGQPVVHLNYARYAPNTGWQAPAQASSASGDLSVERLAVDAQGNAVAVWVLTGSGGSNDKRVFASNLIAGTWSTPLQLSTGSFAARDPQVAITPAGDAIVTWTQLDTGGAANSILSARFVAGAWLASDLIEQGSANASKPQVAIDSNGNAVVVWNQFDLNTSQTTIWANRYTTTSGWGTAAQLETTNTASNPNPQVASDASGNVIAVWQQSDGTRTNIWASRYSLGSGWGVATLLETDDAGAATVPQITSDTSGNAIAIWQQSDGTRTNIWTNRFVPAAP
jgi:hypothetical protein